MKIDSCISELLYRHDCVIVSGLGGFVAQYRTASINPALHVLTPPSKRIAFNAFLQMNDGLLANHIARKLSLDYNDACQLISIYSGDTISSMQEGHKVKIERVGTLYFDHEKNIQFSPDQHTNFLVTSYGMAPVHTPVIRREQKQDVQVKPELKLPEPVLENEPVTGRRRRSGWKIMEIIPAAAVITFLFISPPVLNRINDHLSSLLPFSRMEEFVEEWKGLEEVAPKPVFKPVIPPKNIFDIPPTNPEKAARLAKEYKPTSDASTGSSSVSSHIPSANASQLELAHSSNPVSTVSEATETPGDVPGYHIIVGCFRSKKNAGKFIEQMNQDGLQAEMIGRNRAGLIMVSIFSSPTEAQAKAALDKIRLEHIPEAWLQHTIEQ